jgi:hypothetical protein
LLLLFVEKTVERVELPLPEALVVGQPVGHGAQRVGVDAIEPPPSGAPLAHQAGRAQHRQVLRHRRQADVEGARQLVHRLLAEAQAIEQAAPGAVGDGAEDIFGRGRSSHGHVHT